MVRKKRKGAVFVDPGNAAGRGLNRAFAQLPWSQQDLAEQSGVGIVTVRQLEGGSHEPLRATLQVIRQTFEKAGVEFVAENGGAAGVRLRKPGSTVRKT
jgi:transcriptional regulator with XRE-family HTH domain